MEDKDCFDEDGGFISKELFVWKRYINYKKNIVKGPHFATSEWMHLGKKSYWSLDELLTLPFNNTIKKDLVN